ncbi:MAG: DNA gyrase subunit A [Nanoarchaeota archaeon]|nr:DNA gyrase subunit A [Nanoarchaeota archaeon]
MDEQKQNSGEKIVPRIIEDEMRQSYVDYAMSVIVGRALPDVRDGLKPVHRRILFASNELGLQSNKPFRKCARIVGDVLGKYHPHGDTAVYDSLVRMAQNFSLRYPLINGHGNFGSVDGDNAAAMRYTEAKMQKLAEELLEDIDKETVAFQDNFDGSMKEPTVLPSKAPNLLINGSSGIAVGMATNIPPHNLNETCDAAIAYIDNNDIDIDGLMQHIKAPDFPTGGIICGTAGIRLAYKTGRGKVIVRAKSLIDEEKHRIIITEIPYAVNKADLIVNIATLVKTDKIPGISDIRDESDRDGMRIVFELKKDANAEVILNLLYKHSRLQDSFGIGIVALVENRPRRLNLKELIHYFVEHRKVMVTKRTQYDLKKAQERAHILEGLLKALNDIDNTVSLIKESKSVDEARKKLMGALVISEIQANAILEMRLSRLTALEQDKIKLEHEELQVKIEHLKGILASKQKILDIIKAELNELKEKFGDKRLSRITEMELETFDMEDLIKQERMVLTITHSGYIKRQPLDVYKQQKRGGKGVIAAGTKEQDFVEDLFVAHTHSYILFFTDKGKIHWLKVYHVPEGSRQALGKSIANLLDLEEDEKITAFIPVAEFKEGQNLIMTTRKGTIKKTGLTQYSRPRKGGIIAITLEDDDELISVKRTDGSKQILIATMNGMAIKFNEKDVRPTGRSAKGVRGIHLKNDDQVIDMVIGQDEMSLLTITEFGYGKQTSIAEYRLIGRGGVGVKNIICSDRNGKVIAVKSLEANDELMFISRKGITIRTAASGISVIGRATQGMRLMRLSDGDRVVAAAKIINEEVTPENGNGETPVEGTLESDEPKEPPKEEPSTEPEEEQDSDEDQSA